MRSICFYFLQYRVVKFVCLFLLVSLDLYDIPSVDEVFKNIRKPTTTIFSCGVILHGVRWSVNQTCSKKDTLLYKESIALNSTYPSVPKSQLTLLVPPQTLRQTCLSNQPRSLGPLYSSIIEPITAGVISLLL